MTEKFFYGNTLFMNKTNFPLNDIITEINSLKGLRVKLKVNRGRNKTELIEGIIENAYPNIFTVRKISGEIHSFGYADVISRNVRFLKPENPS